MKSFISKPIAYIRGEISPPGDKSISHRAVMLASIASGVSEFTNFLEADDCLRTIDAFKKMGVSVSKKNKKWIVRGVGLEGLRQPEKELYLGNSGTTMRLLLGILSHQPFRVKLTGDASLSRRAMRRVAVPLRKMGAKISGREDANFAPLYVEGGKLKAINYVNNPASAQVKSAILLAGLRAKGTTTVQELTCSRDHTERMLEMMGAEITRRVHETRVKTTNHLRPIRYHIPGDISSASFMMAASAILPGSDLVVQNVGLNPTRIGVLEILRAMGAKVEWKMKLARTLEPIGTIRVQGSELRAVTIDQEMVPKLIDELPILMVVCALAKGKSVIKDARELRIKETDRIQSMVRGLNAIGGIAEELEDGCLIRGVKCFRGGRISSFGDHRTAMSFAVAGLRSRDPIQVDDIECIDTSYPRFFDHLKKLACK